MRIDKIKKKNTKSNIIDLDIESIGVKYNNVNSPINDTAWHFKSPIKGGRHININKIVNEKDFNHYLPILKDIRFVVQNEIKSSSFKTVLGSIIQVRFFFSFLNKRSLKINELKDIDYNLLSKYSEFLKSEKSAKSKWQGFILFMKKASAYNEIEVHNDILNRHIPSIRFNNTANTIEPYSENEFKAISKTIVSILNDYFKSEEIEHYTFVKTAYWFFALCTGLNKTAINNLTIDSFELLKEDGDLKTYIITGVKNRSKNGIQQQTITIENKSDHIFEMTLKELQKINQDLKKYGLNDEYLFNFQKYTLSGFMNVPRFIEDYKRYNGESQALLCDRAYTQYAKRFNAENINLSTLKIRNHWSMELFEATNSEQVVSQMLGHENLSTTQKHYMKSVIGKDVEAKFNLFQELVHLFSKEENINDWVEFQKRLNIKEESIEALINKIKKGSFDTSLGKCVKSESLVCQSYLNCFNCQHFSIVGDKDLWKVLSFKEALIELKSKDNNYNSIYLPIIDKIDSILGTFDKNEIIKARNLLRKERHPFWKNNIMIKTITDNFEREQND